MTVPVLWHTGGRGSWCHTIVEHMTHGYEHIIGGMDVGPSVILVVKADFVEDISELNRQLDHFERVVLIVTANEEGHFDTTHILHPRVKIWLQTPHDHQFCHRSIPWGWTPNSVLVQAKRALHWSFAGQNTHERRNECIQALRQRREKKQDGILYETNGFSKGISGPIYSQLLSSSKLVPCPSGPITVDSFRVCEALECGAIPLVDTKSPTGSYGHYWYRVFGEKLPFPLVFDWAKFDEIVEEWLTDWDEKAAVVQGWWKAKKGEWIRQLAEDANVWTP